MLGHPLDCLAYVVRQRDDCFDAQPPARDLAVISVVRNLAARLNLSEDGIAWRVIPENIERIFAGVEAAFACRDSPVILECLANLELIPATLHVEIEALERRDRCVDHRNLSGFPLRLSAHSASLKARSS